MSDPVGTSDIMRRQEVSRSAVTLWRKEDTFPKPRWEIGGRPAWEWADVHQWLIDTGRTPGTDIVHVSGHIRVDDPLDAVRAAVVHMDEQRQALVAHGDAEGLAHGIQAIAVLRKDLGLVEKTAKRDLAALMGSKWLEVEGLGRVERVREGGRDTWDDRSTLMAILRPIADPDGTGEIPSWLPEVTDALIDRVVTDPDGTERTVSGAVRPSWRVTQLRELGIDPDDEDAPLRERSAVEDRPMTVKMPSAESY